VSQAQASYKTQGLDGFGVIESSNTYVALRLPIPPSANRYWRSYNGKVVVSEEAQQYKWQVKLLCGQLDPFPGNVSLTISIYRARKSGDLDNYLKVALDSLKGILYPDDNAVVEIHALRHDDKDNPCMVLQARRVR